MPIDQPHATWASRSRGLPVPWLDSSLARPHATGRSRTGSNRSQPVPARHAAAVPVQPDRTWLNKPEQPEHAITGKTLEIMASQHRKFFLPEHPITPDEPVQPDRTWLNKPEQPEHSIPGKTLVIMASQPRNFFLPEHPITPDELVQAAQIGLDGTGQDETGLNRTERT